MKTREEEKIRQRRLELEIFTDSGGFLEFEAISISDLSNINFLKSSCVHFAFPYLFFSKYALTSQNTFKMAPPPTNDTF